MQINPSTLEWAHPGSSPVVVEKFFIQRTHYDKKRDVLTWGDARIDVNTQGSDTSDAAIAVLDRLVEGEFYPKDVYLRIIRRTCTIETEVVP
jgi:hypothetical protein